MRARFVGDPKRKGEGPEVLSAFGLTFLKGAWIGVDSLAPALLKKLKGNSHFELDEGKAASGQPQRPAPVAPTPPAPQKTETPETVPPDWRDKHHSTRLKWARSLGGSPTNVAEADAIIEKHLAAPVAAPAEPEQVKPSIVDPPAKGDDDDWSDLDPE